jgi:hypothetical protein
MDAHNVFPSMVTLWRVLTPGQKLLEQPDLGRVCLGSTQPGCKILGGVQPICGVRPGAGRGLSDHRQSHLGQEAGRLLGAGHELVAGTRNARAP